MIRSIAFIHTVALLVERFRPRFQSELPQQRCFHMLDDPGWLVRFPASHAHSDHKPPRTSFSSISQLSPRDGVRER